MSIDGPFPHRRRARETLPAHLQDEFPEIGDIALPADVLDHATSEIGVGTKLGFDATRKLPGEGFKRPWPPLIRMDAAVKATAEQLWKRMH